MRLTDKPLSLGIDKAKREENQVVHASYMRQKTPHKEQGNHLPEGKPLATVEPRSRETHEEGYNNRRTQYRQRRIIDKGQSHRAKP